MADDAELKGLLESLIILVKKNTGIMTTVASQLGDVLEEGPPSGGSAKSSGTGDTPEKTKRENKITSSTDLIEKSLRNVAGKAEFRSIMELIDRKNKSRMDKTTEFLSGRTGPRFAGSLVSVLEKIGALGMDLDSATMRTITGPASTFDPLGQTKQAEEFLDFMKTLVKHGDPMDEHVIKVTESLKKLNGASGETADQLLESARKLGNDANIWFGMADRAISMLVLMRTVERRVLRYAQEVGGIPVGQAIGEAGSDFARSFISTFSKTPITRAELRNMRSTMADEYGGLVDVGGIASFGGRTNTNLTQIVKELAISNEEFVALQRSLQGTGQYFEDILKTGRELGLVNSVTAQEIANNAGAFARAGDDFNKKILEALSNSKKLGIEFSKLDSILTGTSVNFAGSIEAFSQLRAILPQFSIDFEKLMYTSLYGSTQDYTDQLRETFASAGINKIGDLNRASQMLLEQATGLGSEELARIIAGEGEAPIMKSLDEDRNEYLRETVYLLKILAGFGGVQLGIGLWKSSKQNTYLKKIFGAFAGTTMLGGGGPKSIQLDMFGGPGGAAGAGAASSGGAMARMMGGFGLGKILGSLTGKLGKFGGGLSKLGSLGKAVPGLGLLFMLPQIINRLKNKDFIGAGLSGASGLGGIGTLLAGQSALAVSDSLGISGRSQSPMRAPMITSMGNQSVPGAEESMGIGTLSRKLDEVTRAVQDQSKMFDSGIKIHIENMETGILRKISAGPRH